MDHLFSICCECAGFGAADLGKIFEKFSIGEALMLLAFGISWPAAIYRTWKAKNPTGKSLVFQWLILFGYAAGIVHKIQHYDMVIWLYILNLVMVAIDTILVYKYRFDLRRKAEKSAESR